MFFFILVVIAIVVLYADRSISNSSNNATTVLPPSSDSEARFLGCGAWCDNYRGSVDYDSNHNLEMKKGVCYCLYYKREFKQFSPCPYFQNQH